MDLLHSRTAFIRFIHPDTFQGSQKTEQKRQTAFKQGKAPTDKNAIFSADYWQAQNWNDCGSVHICITRRASISNVNDFTILFILKTLIRRRAIVIHSKTYDLWHHINKVCAPCVIELSVFASHKINVCWRNSAVYSKGRDTECSFSKETCSRSQKSAYPKVWECLRLLKSFC